MNKNLRKFLVACLSVTAVAFVAIADLPMNVNAGSFCIMENALTPSQGVSYTDPAGNPTFLMITNCFRAIAPRGQKNDGWYASPNLITSFDKLQSGVNGVTIDGDLLRITDVTLQKLKNLSSYYVNANAVYLLPSFSWLEYSVVYDANGASGSLPADEQTYVYTNSVTLAKLPQSLKLSGHKFLGWGLSPDADSFFAAGAVVENAGNAFNVTNEAPVTLYANWEPMICNVIFNSAGGMGEMVNQQILAETEVSLSSNAFVRVGYEFGGWNTMADGSGDSYSDGQIVSNLLEGASGNLTLYAQWNVNHYSVVFDANGGTGEMPGFENVSYDEEIILPQSCFSNSFLEFKGWATNKTNMVVYGEGEKISKLTVENGAVVTLYAVWETLIYDVEFHANGGNGEMESQQILAGEEVGLSSNLFSRTGYSFVGWGTNEAGIVYSDGLIVSNFLSQSGKCNLYAQWKANEYSVEFNPSSKASGEMAPVVNLEYDKEHALPVNEFVKVGSEFKGWATNENGEVIYENGATIINLTDVNDAIVTLYAVWETADENLRNALDLSDDDDGYIITNDGEKWEVADKTDAKGGKCLRTNKNDATVTFHFEKNGTLSFKWNMENHNPYGDDGHTLNLKYADNGKAENVWKNETHEDWQSHEINVSGAPRSLVFKFTTTDLNGDFIALLDDFKWVSSDSGIAPSGADKPVISAMTSTSSGMSVTFKSNILFDYQLMMSNDVLAPRPWPIFKTIEGTGENLDVEIPVLPDEKKMFYYLRTIKKTAK